MEKVRLVFDEIDNLDFGHSSTRNTRTAIDGYFKKSLSLSEEERELARKYRRDGRYTDTDLERIENIKVERDKLKKDLSVLKNKEAVEEFRSNKDSIIATPINSDDTSAVIGVHNSRTCPICNSFMIIRSWTYNETYNKNYTTWWCTNVNCGHKIKLDPTTKTETSMRLSDPNLDLPNRREIWERKDVLVETAKRIRDSLGCDDEAVLCPKHALPMKLIEKPSADGRLLSTYEYVCLCVDSEGRACQYKVPVNTFPQVSETLRRRDGYGIIH